MVKAYWLFVALIAGAVLGFVGARAVRIDSPGGASPAVPEVAAPEISRPPVAAAAPERRREPALASTTSSPDAGGISANQVNEPAQPARCAGCIYVQGDDPDAPPVLLRDSATVWREEFMGEERDDSWAYLRETEIESSLLADISAGKFSKERIECRATMCEVDLSARGEQVETLRKWCDEKNATRNFATDQPLFLAGTSFQAEGDKASAKINYRKPPRLLPPAKSN